MSAPVFRYHPDPIATGSAVPGDHVCGVCGVHRDTRYDGPIYGEQLDALCLHCVQSGAASRALGDTHAEFSDARDVPVEVPLAVVEEITRRTPGFVGWQE